MTPGEIAAQLARVRQLPDEYRDLTERALVSLADHVAEFFGRRRKHMVCSNAEIHTATIAYTNAEHDLMDAVNPLPSVKVDDWQSRVLAALPKSEVPREGWWARLRRWLSW